MLLDESLSVSAATYQQYRAPQADGQTLITPSSAEIPGLLEANQDQIAAYDLPWGETTLADLARRSRQRLLSLARQYTGSYADLEGEASERDMPIFVSGHQPELFHPGVWFKNFALDQLAKQFQGIGVHLLIDSDECRIPSVRVPSGTVESPHSEAIAFDAAADPMPYEERSIRSGETLQTFASRTRQALAPLGIEPLASTLMPFAIEAAERGMPLGQALSAARHQLERQWGSQTLELPLSKLEESIEFAEFAKELLCHGVESRDAYNAALDDYRSAHRLRSEAQPLPDLGQQNNWYETPFWGWTTDDPVRRGLFVRQEGESLCFGYLSDGRITDTGWRVSIESTASFLKDWQQLQAGGIKIRTRALATTLFARLMLGDLFLHGIGGAKYDQVTDRWAARWLGLKPPRYLTLSGTWRLPIDHPPASPQRLRAITQELRGLTYHPEVELLRNDTPPDGAIRWIDQKRQAVALEKTPSNAAQRHQQIEEANKALQPYVAQHRQALLDERSELTRRRQAAQLLDSREYSFALYPEDWLRERMTEARFR